MNNDYNNSYFWRIRDPDTGEIKRYFKIKGKLIEVDRDVFNICYNSYEKMNREIANDCKVNLISLDAFDKEGAELSNDGNVESNLLDQIDRKDKINEIMKLISKLDPHDRELITNLLVYEKTERELAKQLNVSQNAINKRKRKILKKIRKNLLK